MAYALNRGRRIYYETRGRSNAPALMMIRGLARSGRFWLDVLDALEDDFRLVVPDNLGVGHSDAPLPPYGTAGMADDLARVLDDAGYERAHVCGISLGGMIAMQLALRHPRRVNRLVLGCTTAGGRSATRIPVSAIRSLLAGAGKPFAQTLRDTATVVLSDEYARAHPEVLDQWHTIGAAEPPPMRGLVGQLLAGALHNVERSVANITAPTLVITGDADRLIPAQNSHHLARAIPGAKLEVYPGAGHDFPTEQPERFRASLRAFLRAENPA